MHVISTVQPLHDVLKSIQDGKIRVPNLQRLFVWSAERMIKLFDSIRKGYPIGSVLLWESDERFPSRSQVGVINVKEPPEYGPVKYLLDGQQRLTTLLSCLYLPQTETRRQKWRISYNAQSDSFEVAKSRLGPTDVPVTLFMDGYKIATFLQSGQFEEAQFRRTQQVASIFQQYQLPVITLKEAELREAVDVFGRLNTLGKSLTASELASALSHGYSAERPFDLNERFTEILEKLKSFGLDALSRTTLLRSFLASLDEEDIYTSDLSAIIDRHRSDLNTPLNILSRSMEKAAEFLYTRLGVAGAKSLPYGVQIVVFSEFFRKQPEPTAEQLSALERWFWHSSYTVAYAGNSTSVNVNSVLRRIRALRAGEVFDDAHLRSYRAQAFPTRFHPRSARVRAFLLFLKRQNPRSPRDGALLSQDTLLANGFSDTGRIHLQEGASRELANRILVGSTYRGDIQQQLRSLKQTAPRIFEQTLQSHLISLEAWEALEAGNGEAFRSRRRASLINAEREFLEVHGIDAWNLDEVASEDLDEPLESEDSDAEDF